MSLSRNKSSFLLVFVLIAVSAFSQEKTILSGQIITEEPLNSPVHIINVTRQIGGVRELSGRFSVEVNIGDSLVFSSVQYRKKTIVVSREKLQQNNFTIKLEEDLTELDEVKLHNLSGNLGNDISRIKIFNKFDLNAPMARKPPPSQVERQLFTATTGPGGSRLSILGALTGTIPLDPVINAISGRTAWLKKRKAKDEFKFTIEKAIYLISENTLIEDFEIPKDEVMNFVYYCAENYDLEILLENPLELYEFFKSKSVEFKALSALD
ncbi:carboxypeptidase-like regulatory domain-containing protein [Salegentibacter sp. LM13S]|uniref:carboxypeptidase-like regulatory domain-containing protein n=1 Tax=Salegentibacter lacus TaxID=2873599 RepID=UPI001CCA6F80|nr:carboxypeptidase-like regulatory domain-containing protein [Salegentibacter lacus]MBZ9630713.1 carboxypeptidase-like regulatory domain-containing protein [Salegentibacter lacus]